MCEEPPQRKNRTVDFAGFASVGAATDDPVVALAAPLKPRDARPIVEAVRKARRSIEGRKSGVCMGRVRITTGDCGEDCHKADGF